MHFWAYPSDDRAPDAHDPLKDFYLDALEREIGKPIDREAFEFAWDIAWLRIMVQLGYLLADVANDADETKITRARSRSRAAVDLAREICSCRLP